MSEPTMIRKVALDEHEQIAQQLEALAKEIREGKSARTVHCVVVDITGEYIQRITLGHMPSYSNTLGHLEFAKLLTFCNNVRNNS